MEIYEESDSSEDNIFKQKPPITNTSKEEEKEEEEAFSKLAFLLPTKEKSKPKAPT